MQMKRIYVMVKEQHTELLAEARSMGTESLCPKKLHEMDSISVALQSLVHGLDAWAQEHYIECTRWYHAYTIEYNDYVIDQYAPPWLSDGELYMMLRKAQKTYLTLQAGLNCHKCWPEFRQILEPLSITQLPKADESQTLF